MKLPRDNGGSVSVTSFWWVNVCAVSVCSVQAFNDQKCFKSTKDYEFKHCFEVNSVQSINDDELKQRKQLLDRSVHSGGVAHHVLNWMMLARHRTIPLSIAQVIFS